MILTVGGIKGGTGKTTIAVNLAILRALAGFDVLLVDADEQQTSADFTALRNERREGGAGYTLVTLSGASVRTEVLKLRRKYEDVIIDAGGRDTASQRAALTVSDALVIPFVPRSFDVWTLEPVAALVAEMRAVNPVLEAVSILNRADARGGDNAAAADALRESPEIRFLDRPIGARKAFSNAAAAGLSVAEARPRDWRAIDEIQALCAALWSGCPEAEPLSPAGKGQGEGSVPPASQDRAAKQSPLPSGGRVRVGGK